MNLNTKVKGNFMPDIFVNTNVSAIWNDIANNTSADVASNVFVEFSHNGINFFLVVHYYDIANKSILVGASKVDMDLPNGNPIDHNKVTPLLE